MRFRAATLPVFARLALGLVLCFLGGFVGGVLIGFPIIGYVSVSLGLMPPLLAADATSVRVAAWSIAGAGLGILLTIWLFRPIVVSDLLRQSIGLVLVCGLVLGVVGFHVGPLIRDDPS